jgi:uncharacterized membrane protein YfcA
MSLSLEAWLAVAAVFMLAGTVKGVVGMGLPTVSMGLLGLFMLPPQAAALLVIPSLLTNLWQMWNGPELAALLRRFALLLALLFVGTLLGVRLLTHPGAIWPQLMLGGVLALYGLLGLGLPNLSLPVGWERRTAPWVGFSTGFLTGATGVAVVPLAPYASALNLQREALVQFLGLSFTVSTLALGLGLSAEGHYPASLALTSLALLLPTVLGMVLGQRLRRRIAAAPFRRAFFVAMVLLGFAIVGRALAR